MMDWFEKLTGFRESDYEVTRSRLEVVANRLHSKVNQQFYGVGALETPSLNELRQRSRKVLANLAGKLKVSCISGDVRAMHRDPSNEKALFQVASQFNLLEMTGPSVSPEDGVTRYTHDRTQGPACAIAAGAATIYRNYFADVDGQSGQTRDTQIDCLRDLGAELGNHGNALWAMRNGYALCTEQGLAAIDHRLAASSDAEIDKLRGLLRVGLHWGVEVTDAPNPRPAVSQAFCSALPVSYSSVPAVRWRRFATLVLEGTYEATLCAAILNAQRSSSNVVFLTQVGGGAFGNDNSWILGAHRRALDIVQAIDLDVRLVSYGSPPADLVSLANGY
jgi:hypothetical protein